MFGDLGAGKLVMIIESDIFDCFAQVFDAAKQGILLGIKIFSDSGKNGRDQQIEKVIVLKSRLIQASLQFADERRDVSRIGKLDYLRRLREKRADIRIAGNQMPKGIFQTGNGFGNEFEFQCKNQRIDVACAKRMRDVGIDQDVAVGMHGDLFPVFVVRIYQCKLSIIDIQDFQTIVAVRIIEFVISPVICGIIG